ncbi:MAG: galactose mutarotase [Opitutales bacterium]|nr:galactose mutarotase [Opitutales bacterium]
MPERFTRCSEYPFGRLADGRSARRYLLRGACGLEASVTDYGAALTHLILPDGSGHRVDVILGFNDLATYARHPNYFGAIAGRVAGRIPRGRFALAGKDYQLATNHPPNHLHGGAVGFDKKIWKLVSADADTPAVTLAYESPDGEEGYPGRVRAEVAYRILHHRTLEIEERVVSDTVTPVNLTQHGYFNLAGEGGGDALDHELTVFSDTYVPCDRDMTPTGRMETVAGTAADFRGARRLRDAIPELFQRHGDLYRIRDADGVALLPAARLAHPASGRVMEVRTTHRFLQFYTGVDLDGSFVGKSGCVYGPHAGVCLECEGYPDAVHHPGIDDILVQPGQPLIRRTHYVFEER